MHSFDVRVYYEDTDAGGIVFYANYLKFAERARTELLRTYDVTNSSMLKNERLGIVVRHVEMDLKAPARLDDLLTVNTDIETIKKASFTMRQTIHKHNHHLATIIVKLACINIESGKPVLLPNSLQEIFKNDDPSRKPH
jgi:acyl-CoA thioester hydrolase